MHGSVREEWSKGSASNWEQKCLLTVSAAISKSPEHGWRRHARRRVKCYQLAHVSDMIKQHLISGLWALPHPGWNADRLEHVWVLCRQSQLLGLLEAPWFSDTRSTFKTAQKNTQSCVSSSPSPGKRLNTTEAVAGNWVGPDNTLANCSPWS